MKLRVWAGSWRQIVRGQRKHQPSATFFNLRLELWKQLPNETSKCFCLEASKSRGSSQFWCTVSAQFHGFFNRARLMTNQNIYSRIGHMWTTLSFNNFSSDLGWGNEYIKDLVKILRSIWVSEGRTLAKLHSSKVREDTVTQRPYVRSKTSYLSESEPLGVYFRPKTWRLLHKSNLSLLNRRSSVWNWRRMLKSRFRPWERLVISSQMSHRGVTSRKGDSWGCVANYQV